MLSLDSANDGLLTFGLGSRLLRLGWLLFIHHYNIHLRTFFSKAFSLVRLFAFGLGSRFFRLSWLLFIHHLCVHLRSFEVKVMVPGLTYLPFGLPAGFFGLAGCFLFIRSPPLL